MQHFDITEWSDQVRGLAQPNTDALMQGHLESGCGDCDEIVGFLRDVVSTAEADLAMSPPDGSTDVGLNGGYALRFDERMNPIGFDNEAGQLINVLFSEDNQVLRYSRQGTLAPSTEVTEAVPLIPDFTAVIRSEIPSFINPVPVVPPVTATIIIPTTICAIPSRPTAIMLHQGVGGLSTMVNR